MIDYISETNEFRFNRGRQSKFSLSRIYDEFDKVTDYLCTYVATINVYWGVSSDCDSFKLLYWDEMLKNNEFLSIVEYRTKVGWIFLEFPEIPFPPNTKKEAKLCDKKIASVRLLITLLTFMNQKFELNFFKY